MINGVNNDSDSKSCSERVRAPIGTYALIALQQVWTGLCIYKPKSLKTGILPFILGSVDI